MKTIDLKKNIEKTILNLKIKEIVHYILLVIFIILESGITK